MGINYGELRYLVNKLKSQSDEMVNGSNDFSRFGSHYMYAIDELRKKIYNYVVGKSDENITVDEVLSVFNKKMSNNDVIIFNFGDSNDTRVNIKFHYDRYYGGNIFEWELLQSLFRVYNRYDCKQDIKSEYTDYASLDFIADGTTQYDAKKPKVIEYNKNKLSVSVDLERAKNVTNVFNNALLKLQIKDYQEESNRR